MTHCHLGTGPKTRGTEAVVNQCLKLHHQYKCVFLLRVCCSHGDLGGFIESADPVHEILLVVGLQEELPHPGIDDYQTTGQRGTSNNAVLEHHGNTDNRQKYAHEVWTFLEASGSGTDPAGPPAALPVG